MTSSEFEDFGKGTAKKRFYEVLAHIDEKGSMHYNDVMRYAFEQKLVRSRASITIILNGLTKMGLLERTVMDSRPMRTTYDLTRKVRSILELMKQVERNF
ncbi:hypothetical protein [Candidatus Nitrososphaera evergladensis]|uniref:hypothetical protein n=1 Tax=Candidatus Nitrososphaera evergladensis TaxID=1459637 RepID=UPI0011E5A8D4|nr:hypothetical protein [Candidatus Nitrososphaera evergladensis]